MGGVLLIGAEGGDGAAALRHGLQVVLDALPGVAQVVAVRLQKGGFPEGVGARIDHRVQRHQHVQHRLWWM